MKIDNVAAVVSYVKNKKRAGLHNVRRRKLALT